MIIPTDGMIITEDTTFVTGVYALPAGITLARSGITLDGNGALIVGSGGAGRGVSLEGLEGVTIKNLGVQSYYHGIWARRCRKLTLSGCHIHQTAEVDANTAFLDVWLPADKSYGGGIFLSEVEDAEISGNDLQHQMNGLLAYACRKLVVRGNLASYCSGWGFHLFDTSRSLYEDNFADYCCRYHPRGERSGHLGADAAGFLIIHASSENVFRRNMARLGGDGFFLAGMTPERVSVPSNNNLFEDNDASYSPNIAFEATFSGGNIYHNNRANHCNYGFWMGFSRQCVIEGNQIVGNAQAGIATENGYNFQVRRNQFHNNGYGILLWSKHIPEMAEAVPENDTSYNWTIIENEFVRNRVAVRIAANQDHGIRSFAVPAGADARSFRLPHDHVLQANRFRENVRGLDLAGAEQTNLLENSSDRELEFGLA